MPKQIQTNSDKSKGQPLDFDKVAANKYLKVGIHAAARVHCCVGTGGLPH